ncbi:unnamed protein product [Orchesella dallaii]|uniref:Gluconokinase n=1 Tax=Orchesella dallaii TaxID=48710 RepID=A0ABP1Q3J5_9HEXA
MNSYTNNSEGSNSNPERSIGLIVCGPCACGKSEIASALAAHFQVPFVDADALHSETNIQKMSAGIPLTDQDRLPWLQQVRKELIQKQRKDLPEDENPPVTVVGACSALKRTYRDILAGRGVGGSGDADISEGTASDGDLLTIFVFLKCSEEVLQKRLNARQGHFMKANMLSSQLATLELPQETTEGNRALIVDGDKDLSQVVAESIEKLHKLCRK